MEKKCKSAATCLGRRAAGGHLHWLVLATGLLAGPAMADNGWLRNLERGDLSGAIEGAARSIGHGGAEDSTRERRRPPREDIPRRGDSDRRGAPGVLSVPVETSPQQREAIRKERQATRRATRDLQRKDTGSPVTPLPASRQRTR